MIFLMTVEACGVCSDGLIITQFPAAIAETSGPKARLIGKFQGEMIKTTPLGS